MLKTSSSTTETDSKGEGPPRGRRPGLGVCTPGLRAGRGLPAALSGHCWPESGSGRRAHPHLSPWIHVLTWGQLDVMMTSSWSSTTPADTEYLLQTLWLLRGHVKCLWPHFILRASGQAGTAGFEVRVALSGAGQGASSVPLTHQSALSSEWSRGISLGA